MLAKLVAGGFPGAAVAGRADILGALEFTGSRAPAVARKGTYNAGPVSAAAGIVTLRLLRDTDLIARANRRQRRFEKGFNAVLRRTGAARCAYGDFSGFHLFTNPDREPVTPADIQAAKVAAVKLKGGTPLDLSHKIRAGFLAEGVDIIGWVGGVVSGVHGAAEVDRTGSAMEDLLPRFAEEGELR